MNVENVVGIYDLLKANFEIKSKLYNSVINMLEGKYQVECLVGVLHEDEQRLLNEKRNELDNAGRLLYAFGHSEVQL